MSSVEEVVPFQNCWAVVLLDRWLRRGVVEASAEAVFADET